MFGFKEENGYTDGDKPLDMKTVPSNEQLDRTENIKNQLLDVSKKAFQPLSFLVPGEDVLHSSPSILDLPLEIQTMNNFKVLNSADFYASALNSADLIRFNTSQIYRQHDQIVSFIIATVNNILISWLDQSQTVRIIGKCISNQDCIYTSIFNTRVLRKITDENIQRQFYSNLSTSDIFVISDEYSSFKNSDKELNRIIAMAEILSKQIVEITASYICSIVSDALTDFIGAVPVISDFYEKTYQIYKGSLNEDAEKLLSNRNTATMLSFYNFQIREELKDLILSVVIPNIENITQNYYLTNYFVFKDLEKDQSNIVLSKYK
jgi:hypothetical protein